MNEFFENLKRQATENPTMALVVATGLLTAAGRFIDAAGHAKGSKAYAKQIDHKIKNSKK